MAKYEAHISKSNGDLAIVFKDDEPLKKLNLSKGDNVKVSVEHDHLIIEKKGWF